MSIILSGVIITYNEEKNIEDCINSLKGIADEVIVVDAFSDDNTKNICERLGVKFFQRKWDGFSNAKNWGNSMAKGHYILSIDADERVSDELKKSIFIYKNNFEGRYAFNRLNNYCGKWIRNSGWYPDRKIRIFPKEGSTWNENALHERLTFENKLSETVLEGDLLHYSFDSIERHILKINNYTTIEALEAYKNGENSTYFKLIFSPIVKFVKIFLLHKAFLDGYHGFLIASFSSYSKFLKYSKLKHLYLKEADTKKNHNLRLK